MKRNFHRRTLVLTILLAASTGPFHSRAMAQSPIQDSVTIDQHESLLIGSIDVTRASLANPERSFFLKGNVPYRPDNSQRIELEQVRGFSGKWFFFLKLRPLYETTKSRQYTLAVRTPSGWFHNIVTFPVSARRCAVDKQGKTVCGEGLTDLGRIVVSATMSEQPDDRGFKYAFERHRDETVQAAFSRRFALETTPRSAKDPSDVTVLVVRRRN